MIDMVLWQ